MWEGEPDTGRLIMRNTVQADDKIAALQVALLPIVKLIEVQWAEFSLRIDTVE
jgi:hypothetical protein